MLDNYIDGSDVIWQHVKRYKNKVSIIRNGNLPFQNYIFHAMIISQNVWETYVIKVITFELLNDILVLPFC